MSNLLSELEAVVGLADLATPGEWYADPCVRQGAMIWSKTETGFVVGAEDEECRYGSIEAENAEFVSALVNLFRTHHAEIAAAVRDAARYRFIEAAGAVSWDVGKDGMVTAYVRNHAPAKGANKTAAIDAAMSAREG